MKISKSKQELARIISENGGWRDGAQWSAQDKNGIGMYSGGKPYWDLTYKEWTANAEDGCCTFVIGGCNTVSNYHQTAISREEYFHLYPAPDADGWIEWKGGECPVYSGTLVDIKDADGEEWFSVKAAPQDGYSDASGCFWEWRCSEVNRIVAYRLHKPEQAGTEFCESVTRSIPEPETKPTIEQLADDYRNRKDYADSKQQEADAAKADADEALRKLELAGEAIGLIVTPARVEKEPELVITDWRDLQVGDVIKCIGCEWDDGFEGNEAVVAGVENRDYKYDHRIRAVIGDESDWGKDFIFIRRQ